MKSKRLFDQALSLLGNALPSKFRQDILAHESAQARRIEELERQLEAAKKLERERWEKGAKARQQ